MFDRVGGFELRVVANGFQTQLASHLNLDIQQTLRKDFSLSPGVASITVQVELKKPLNPDR